MAESRHALDDNLFQTVTDIFVCLYMAHLIRFFFGDHLYMSRMMRFAVIMFKRFNVYFHFISVPGIPQVFFLRTLT